MTIECFYRLEEKVIQVQVKISSEFNVTPRESLIGRIYYSSYFPQYFTQAMLGDDRYLTLRLISFFILIILCGSLSKIKDGLSQYIGLQFLVIRKMHKDNKHRCIYSVSFNPDYSLMALATNIGFKIYTLSPTTLKQQRDFGAPIQTCELIDRSNLIGLVGFKDTPFAPPNKLAIFDDNTQRIIADMSFKSNIMQVKIRQGKIVVALHNKAYVINLFTMEIQHIIETFKFQENEKYNIISMSNDEKNLILAAPGTENGQVLLVYFNKLTERRIKAHQSILSALVISQDGEKLVTTSQKGIQVRIFDTRTGEMIQQVRRGNQFANIYSLVLSRRADWLAVSSDSCNVHIFTVKSTQAEKQRYYERGQQHEQKQNPKSMFYFMKKIFPHFHAQYSLCYHKIEEYNPDVQTFLSFTGEDNLVMMTNIGLMQRVSLNPSGGKCQLQQKKCLIQKNF